MSKAQVIETVERDGVKVLVYDNGMERNAETKRMLRGPTHALITAENNTLFHRRRQEKAAAALRSRILAATQRKSDIQLTGAADAVAEAGGILWDEIVLADPETAGVYPRDRIEAWEKLGKYAQVLPADVRQPAEPPTSAPADTLTALAALVRELRTAIQPARADVVDGEASDA